MNITKIISCSAFAAAISSALLLCSAVSYAGLSGPGHMVAGLEIGYGSRLGDLEAKNFEINGAPVLGEQRESINNYGTLYGALLGYQFVCQNVLVGVEGFVDVSHYHEAHNFSIPLLGTQTQANLFYYRDATFGGSARVGYVSPWVTPYVRLGVHGGNDVVSINYSALNTVLPLIPWDSFERKETHYNWFAGAGLEIPFFSRNTSLRLEYDYTWARPHEYTDTVLPVAAQYAFNPHAHAVKLQAVWNFI